MWRIKEINSEEDTRRLGFELAEKARPGQLIALIGDLGVGKTALTRHIAEGLGVKGHVTSPTFTIIKEYKSGRLPLYHFDVYRIDDPDEMYELGFEEYFYGDGLCIVEWADKIRELLPQDADVICMEYGEAEGTRHYRIGRQSDLQTDAPEKDL